MVAFNPPGPPNNISQPAINPATLAQLVDANDLIVPSAPQMILAPVGGAGNAGGYAATPVQVLTAILIELRVQNTLFQMNSTTNLDLGALRADEYDSATGGVLS